jgi:hypothetical protein
MTHEEVCNALVKLGFESGWVVNGTEIVLWEHDVPVPTEEELRAA